MVESKCSKDFNQSKYSVSFGGNLSGVIMEFKLIIKNNTEVTVCCSNGNRYCVNLDNGMWHFL